jgi:hypothetical protein
MFLNWLGKKKTKRCDFLSLVIIIRVSYLKKIRMIGQMDGLGNDQT